MMSTGCIIAYTLRVWDITLKPESLKSCSSRVSLNLTRAWTKIFSLSQVSGMMVLIVQHEKGNQVGYFRFKYPVLTVNTSIS